MSGDTKFPGHARQLLLHTMMILIAAVAIYLWLVLVFPAILLISAVWGPSVYFARRLINRMRSEGHDMPAEDQVAAFLAVSLFCVPITALVLGNLRAILSTYFRIHIDIF